MSATLSPEDLLAMLRRRVGDSLNGAAVYTGTLPLIGNKFATDPYFEAELSDDLTGRSLRCAYRVRRADV